MVSIDLPLDGVLAASIRIVLFYAMEKKELEVGWSAAVSIVELFVHSAQYLYLFGALDVTWSPNGAFTI